jgi:hypothetical protein
MPLKVAYTITLAGYHSGGNPGLFLNDRLSAILPDVMVLSSGLLQSHITFEVLNFLIKYTWPFIYVLLLFLKKVSVGRKG